ncbi:rhodanese-like domain-containing protein [Shewanella gelidii]|uniref:Rhodanese-like domain-containing protein n=1 Tax=Shewanella gelidii TaxID=1642821 RepID=A0A917JYE9_9GAMM|nr:rhodanese-like domain-containing protein [Shewanella gelidii]MCL1098964.1 rhodanese-like domain-containing protein [Shewanella gelidii]GGI90307.1 rhodanese-like domain-containing protein [Shewanella gelidii]
MQEYFDFLQANPVLSLAWVGLFIALIISTVKSNLSKVKGVTHQQATQLINKQEAKVVDVRAQDAFKKGHIVGAVNVPLSDIKNNQIPSLEKHKARPIILVCDAGVTSSQAGQLLVKQGFEDVNNLKGGMNDWTAANLPVSKRKK